MLSAYYVHETKTSSLSHSSDYATAVNQNLPQNNSGLSRDQQAILSHVSTVNEIRNNAILGLNFKEITSSSSSTVSFISQHEALALSTKINQEENSLNDQTEKFLQTSATELAFLSLANQLPTANVSNVKFDTTWYKTNGYSVPIKPSKAKSNIFRDINIADVYAFDLILNRDGLSENIHKQIVRD